MGTSAEIYKYERRLNRTLARVKSSRICDTNKDLIEKFHRYLLAHGLSLGRVIKYLVEIRRVAEQLNKPFTEVTKDDLMDLVLKIERRQDYTEWTKHDYKLSIKKFFKFLRGTDDYPDEVAWIRLNTSNNKRLLPDELLTEEEVMRMAEVARTPRNKALILVLYETGCRIGEIFSLKIKNVQFDEYGAVLTVDGKTGMRRVRIISSAQSLATWMNNHPLRESPNAPLWVSLGTRNRDSLITHRAVNNMLKNTATKAGIRKRVYPHLFRHSRATHLASQIPESLLKKHMGWVQGSDMPATYVHLSGQELDKALLQVSGIQIGDKKKEDKLNIIKCSRCGNDNSAGSKYCFSCGLCFDLKTAIEIDETRKKVNELLDALVKSPEKLEVLIKLLQSKS